MDTCKSLLKEAVEKLRNYGPNPPVVLSRRPADVSDPAALVDLLDEAVTKIDNCAARQGRVRMGAREMGADGNKHQAWINPNPNAGQHYPAVQSFLDRARHALSAASGSPSVAR